MHIVSTGSIRCYDVELQAQSETAPKLKLGNIFVNGAAYEDPLSLIVARNRRNTNKIINVRSSEKKSLYLDCIPYIYCQCSVFESLFYTLRFAIIVSRLILKLGFNLRLMLDRLSGLQYMYK